MRIVLGLFNIVAVDKSLGALAKKHIGVTYDIRECGYIMPDGTMLDFSGRRLTSPEHAPYLRGQRNMDHRELPEPVLDVLIQKYGHMEYATDYMMAFMLETGAARFYPKIGSLSFFSKPTMSQLKKLVGVWNTNIPAQKGWSDTLYLEQYGEGSTDTRYGARRFREVDKQEVLAPISMETIVDAVRDLKG